MIARGLEAPGARARDPLPLRSIAGAEFGVAAPRMDRANHRVNVSSLGCEA